MLYTGREYDQETKLYYYRARYYDAEIGRFISEDPLGFKAGINFYAYVNNNPVNFNDPFGKEGFPACPGCLIPPEIFTETVPNFIEGVVSYPIGLVRAGDFGIQISGLRGDELQARAELNFDLFTELSQQAIANPQFTFDLATDFVSKNPALVAGRLTAGVGVAALVRDPRVGAGLGGLAAFGDAINAIDNGVRNLEGLVPAVVGGQSSNIQLDLDIQINQSFNSQGAGGGFVLYPNRPNTNTLQTVYLK